ncbi:MAG TPA: HEAT repeat domain-containing protein [Polyangiaceae bacterium]
MIQEKAAVTVHAGTSIEEAMMLALRSSDTRIRAGAITQAARSADPEDLVEAVADQSNALRRNAAIDALTRAGPRGVPTLIRALKHADVEVVMFAAGILGKTRDATAVPHLVRLLEHEDINVAQGAIESLAQLRAAPAVNSIIVMFDRDPWLRFSAIHALGDIGDPRAVPSLEALLRQDDELGDPVVRALGRIGSAEAVRVLSEYLLRCHKDEGLFYTCLRALGTALQQVPDPSILEGCKPWMQLATPEAGDVHLRLIKVLSSDLEPTIGAGEELELKASAIEVIRALKLKALYGALVRAARDPLLREPLQFGVISLGAAMAPALALGLLSPEASVRLLSCQCVGALALPELTPQLERLLADRDDEVRTAAVEAVARVSREAAVPMIAGMLADPRETVSEAAASVLKQMDVELVSRALHRLTALSPRGHILALEIMRASPHESQRPTLLRDLRHSSPEVRRAAVAALARQPATDILADLVPMLEDPSVDVRREALVALGRCRSVRARELLLLQVASDPETRTYAIRTLGELGDCAVAPLLSGMMERESPLARIAIIGALADLRDTAAEPLLVRALGDAEPEVRRAAVDALARFGTRTAVRYGLAAARDSEWRVRAASIELLALNDEAPSIAALERLCFDENEFVCAAARRRLDQKKLP